MRSTQARHEESVGARGLTHNRQNQQAHHHLFETIVREQPKIYIERRVYRGKKEVIDNSHRKVVG